MNLRVFGGSCRGAMTALPPPQRWSAAQEMSACLFLPFSCSPFIFLPPSDVAIHALLVQRLFSWLD